MKILIADDDHITRLMLERTLTKTGYETVVTADGAEAWKVLQQPEGAGEGDLEYLWRALAIRASKPGSMPTTPLGEAL